MESLTQNIGDMLAASAGAEDLPTEPDGEQPTSPEPAAEPETVTDDDEVLSQTDPEPEPDPDAALLAESLTETPEEPKEPSNEETPEWLQKRINKAVRKQKEAEEEAAALREELEKAKAAQPEQKAPSPADPKNPFDRLRSTQDVDQEMQVAKARVEFVEELEELLIDDPAAVAERLKEQGVKTLGGDEDFSETEMAKFLKRVKREENKALTDFLPKRKADLQKASETTEFAKSVYSYIGNPESKWSAIHEDIARLPWLANVPEKDLFIARYLRGYQAELQAKGKQPVTKAKRVPASPAKPKAAAPQQAPPDELQKHRDRLKKDPSQKSLQGMIAAQLG